MMSDNGFTSTTTELTDDEVKEVTRRIKQLADVKNQSMEDVDAVLRSFHSEVTKNEMSHHVGIALANGHTPNFFANP
jgi:flagellar motor switch protein FliG